MDLNSFIENEMKNIRETVGENRVLLALSGGVDSSVCAALLAKAIPGQLTCVFVDHGFMRKNEGDEVRAAFKDFDLKLISINVAGRFINLLKGITDPEEKRKLVGAEFARVFEEESAKLGDIPFLAQGTIYPDVVESGKDKSSLIKSHHNVGGLPKNLSFSGIIEPLRDLYKEDVRKLGRLLGLSAALTERQPFPGPGLSVRVIGEVTEEKLDILRESDAVFREEVDASGIKCSQFFAVLTNTNSTGIHDGKRAYEYVIALRAITTTDFMTAECVPLPYELLLKCADRISKEVPGAGRVVYDLSGKPPMTIEWE